MAVLRQILEHPGDPHLIFLAAADSGDGAAERIRRAEALHRLLAADDETVGAVERGLRIAGEEGDFQDLEEGRVGAQQVGIIGVGAVQENRPVPLGAGDRLDLGEVLGQGLGDHPFGALLELLIPRLGVGVEGLDLVDAAGVRQPLLEARLVADVEQDEDAGGEAQSEAGDVDEGIGPALGQRPETHGKIIAPHRPNSLSCCSPLAPRSPGAPAGAA